MRIESLQRELESTIHTLIDLKTVMECVRLTLERTEKTTQNINPRIKMLEGRIDKLTIDIAKEKEYEDRRSE